MLICGGQLSLKKAAGFFSSTTSALLTALILPFFADHSNQDGWIPRGNKAMEMGATHQQDGTHSKCTIFHTKCHFSCPRGITSLSPLPRTNELFLLHLPTVSLPLLSLLCLLGCSSALPASEGLGMVIFSFFILVTCLALGFTEQQLKRLNILSS